MISARHKTQRETKMRQYHDMIINPALRQFKFPLFLVLSKTKISSHLIDCFYQYQSSINQLITTDESLLLVIGGRTSRGDNTLFRLVFLWWRAPEVSADFGKRNVFCISFSKPLKKTNKIISMHKLVKIQKHKWKRFRRFYFV